MFFLDPPGDLLRLVSAVEHVQTMFFQLGGQPASAAHPLSLVELLEATLDGLVRRHVFPRETGFADLALHDAMVAALHVLLQTVHGMFLSTAPVLARNQTIFALALRVFVHVQPRQDGQAAEGLMRAANTQLPQSIYQEFFGLSVRVLRDRR